MCLEYLTKYQENLNRVSQVRIELGTSEMQVRGVTT
jgi:hypothetical protein